LEPISFTGKLTLQDALDLNWYHWRIIIRPPFRWMVSTVSFLIALLCIWSAFTVGFSSVIVPLLFLCAYFPLGWMLERSFLVRRRYRRHPEHYVESTVKFAADAVTTENANMQMRLAWNQLGRFVDTPRGLLVLIPPHSPICWLPSRLFEGNDAKEKILSLASSHNVPVTRMA